MTGRGPLPVDAVLPDLLSALREGSAAVLVAPPGAGKTTAVAPALLDEPWCDGEILLLSPRRLAARAAAERIAGLRGEAVGGTIGYRTRMDSKVSRATRLTVLTPGLFVNRIVGDPELAGVSAVLFDEVHERALDSDFGLALAVEAQRAFRPDLRLLPMSATIDGARFAALLGGDVPVLESAGRAHPLRVVHVGRDPAQRIEEAMAATIRRALAEEAGDALAFLPGVREIERTAEALRLPGDTDLHLLHGTLDPAAQRAALRPAPPGRRKCILATSIAETSLTIDGVRIVIDSGLSRRPRFDRAAGVARLVTERASLASVTQRAGRAARQGPGVAWRLWEAAAEGGLLPFDPPEIAESDLAPLLLACARFGENEPARLPWLDPPPAAGIAEARARLEALGALDGEGRATETGEAIAALPLAPPLAAMLVTAARAGAAEQAAEIAVLVEERGLGGSDADLDLRLARWREQRGGRAEAARGLARRWARLAAEVSGGLSGRAEASPLPSAMLRASGAGGLVALAFPERVARRRDASGEDWLTVGGRGFRLDPASPLARAEWLAVTDASGAAGGARILSAAALEEAAIPALFAERIEQRSTVRWLADADRVEALVERRLGAIRLAGGPDPEPDPRAIADALLGAVRAGALDRLPWSAGARSLRRRAAYAGSTVLADDALAADVDAWLAPLLAGRRRLADVDAAALLHALEGRLGWEEKTRIDRVVPSHFTSPAGTRHEIAWDAPGGPTVELRVQALYGLADHPQVGGEGVPLILSLTSPAGRPIQTTRDLPGFWAGSWRDVAKEMRGRYPRHDWPDDPARATPSLRTKKAQARG